MSPAAVPGEPERTLPGRPSRLPSVLQRRPQRCRQPGVTAASLQPRAPRSAQLSLAQAKSLACSTVN